MPKCACTCMHTLNNNFIHSETNCAICCSLPNSNFNSNLKCSENFISGICPCLPNACKCLYPSIYLFPSPNQTHACTLYLSIYVDATFLQVLLVQLINFPAIMVIAYHQDFSAMGIMIAMKERTKKNVNEFYLNLQYLLLYNVISFIFYISLMQ